ncbi:MAG: hypothetical protein V4643_14205 [Bacteroidota bacterium]
MELFGSTLCIVGGIAGILRGWMFFILKGKSKNINAKPSFFGFLWRDFGKISQLFIWYIPLQKVRTDLNKYIKIMNFLTTVILISFVILILFTAIIIFT